VWTREGEKLNTEQFKVARPQKKTKALDGPDRRQRARILSGGTQTPSKQHVITFDRRKDGAQMASEVENPQKD